MQNQALYNERLKLFKDTIRFEHTSRVPLYSAFYTWKFLDSEFKLSEAMNDFGKAEKAVRDFHERYQFDGYEELGTRNMVQHINELGISYYHIDDEAEAINYKEVAMMQPTEYADLIRNPKEFYWKMFCRKYEGLDKRHMVSAIRMYLDYGKFCSHMGEIFREEYNVPAAWGFNSLGLWRHPFEKMFQYYRGIRGISLDLRRHYDELKEAIACFKAAESDPAMESLLAADTSEYITDFHTSMLANSILNRKQWEDLYWPLWQELLDRIVAADKTIFIFCESKILPFAEYFESIPKGHVVVALEQDDVFEFRKRLPNICICGGMKCEMLGRSSKEVCVDYTKRLLDELGEGFIFSQDKMVSFRNDCKRENLLAVNDFVRNYRT